jgi:hypothetical protein
MSDSVLNALIPPWRHELQRVLTALSTNVLIIGEVPRVQSEVEAVLAESRIAFSADQAAGLAGTYVVGGVEGLTRDQQSALLNRLNQEPPLRVIAISAVPLYPLVQSKGFDDTLYYRLNTIIVDCTMP